MPNILKLFFRIAFLWLVFNIFLVVFAWGKSYFVDFGVRPATYSIDLRDDKSQKGNFITFVATQAEPEKQWLFGHLWVSFETTPPNEKAPNHQFGYYAANKTAAAIELVNTSINPLGFFMGQKPVLGQIQIDDPWPHHLELRVNIDSIDYENAIKTHQKWRLEKEYYNRGKMGKNAKGCQDYAFDIAQSIGLKTPKNHWGEFPPESFVNLAQANDIKIEKKLSLGAYFNKKTSHQ